MTLKIHSEIRQTDDKIEDQSKSKDSVFSKDYVDFLNEAGWKLERKLPSNSNYYSDLLEDTDWKYSKTSFNCSIHYRRDLDALS